MARTATASELVARLSDGLTTLAGLERVGVDAVHIPTWERHLQLGGQPLLTRTYSASELAFCAGRVERLAARLAGKEAVLKVFGTGIRGVGLGDVEIVSTPSGRPTVAVQGAAQQAMADAGLGRVEISLCHEHEYALAVAIGVREGDLR